MKTALKSLTIALGLLLPLATIAQTSADSSARAILAQMSVRQKVHELHGRGVVKFGLSILVRKKVRSVKAGGDRKLGIPPTIFLDGPRGVSLYKGTTAFPVTMARGASWDPALEQRVGTAIATEILALGANYSGAVCMNLLRHPRWGRSQETYGEDPHHVGQMAVALTLGIQALGVQACAKHFAVNSMENNRFGGDFIVDERTLHEVYLPHFKKVIDAGVASVMSSYNQLNGEYCGHSRLLLTDILRQQWGFRGYVTSDWQHGLRDTKAGIHAGMNVEMPSGTHYSVRRIKRLIRDREITEAHIDTLVLPIVRTKLQFAARRTEPRPDKDVLACTAHRTLAREVAEQSAVLLKNEASALPLDLSELRSIAVVGSLANSVETGDHGSSRVFATDVVSPLAGIRAYLKDADMQIHTATSTDSIGAVCQRADAVVVVAGTTWEDEGEYIGQGGIRDSLDREKLNPIVKMKVLGRGGDRRHLNLHPQDIATIKAAAMVNGRVIVVLVAG
ncbi:MAG: glycoside hydrolase family 3 C-terminal domain-containing protein, partial [Flavobacteriales bacterium]|nr:glycoside hydrolase family 3 C-terminal domain-containing protein [Flavobacteriales bacterium]